MQKFLSNFKIWITVFLAASSALELIFYFSVENLFAVSMLALSWGLFSFVCITQRNLDRFPVSFLMILGMVVFQYILPIPLTLLDGNSVTNNLRIPYLTFFHHFLFAVVISFTYIVYGMFFQKTNIFSSVLRKTIFYEQVSNRVVWITALLALASSFYDYFVINLWEQRAEDRDLIFYVTTILSQYIWMPLVILFPRFRVGLRDDRARNFKFIIAYSVVVFLIAVASNWRTVLFSGVFIVLGLFGFGLLLEHYRFKDVFNLKRVVFVLCAIFVFIGPVNDLTQAMVIVRHDRYEISGLDFIKRTMDVFFDKTLLSKYKSESVEGGDVLVPSPRYEWSEKYLNNPTLNRMVNLKFSDNCMYFANEISYGNADMQQEFKRQISALLPNIFLPLFNVTLDEKIDAASYSIGDYLYSLASNQYSVLGSFTVSSMPGVGLAIFGYWYFVVVFVIFFVIFGMFDSFIFVYKKQKYYSYLFFMMFTGVVNYFNDRHVFVFEFRFLIRTYFETVIIFLITLYFVRLVSCESRSINNYWVKKHES